MSCQRRIVEIMQSLIERHLLLFLAFLAPIAATKTFTNGNLYGRTGEHDAFPVQRIAFGSCNKHDEHNPLWDGIDKFNPDLFVWLGDAIYSDKNVAHPWLPGGIQMVEKFQSADMAEQRRIYGAQKLVPGYSRLRNNSWVLGVWDDHDYGLNDAGKEYDLKEESRTNFLDFLEEPTDSPRRADDHPGVYASYTYGPPGQRVRVILLDTRFNRDPLLPEVHGRRRPSSSSAPSYASASIRTEHLHRRLLGEPLDPSPGGSSTHERGFGDGERMSDIPGGDILGEEQWRWLRDLLVAEKTEYTIIASSIQVVENNHSILRPFFSVEGWGRFPECRERLFSLLTQTGTQGVIFFTGDVHFASLARLECALPYPVYDLTTSGMTHAASTHFPWPIPQAISHTLPVQFAVTDACLDLNWASLEFHWPEESGGKSSGKGAGKNAGKGAGKGTGKTGPSSAGGEEEEEDTQRQGKGYNPADERGRSQGHEKASAQHDPFKSRKEPANDGWQRGGGDERVGDDEWVNRHPGVPWLEMAVHAVAKWDPQQRPYVAFHRRVSLDELTIPSDLAWKEHCHRHGVYEQDLPWYIRYRFATLLVATIVAFLVLVYWLLRQAVRLVYRSCHLVAGGSMPMHMRRLCCQVSVRLMPSKTVARKVE
eukprot:jgi/Mesvir1/25952/Mv20944-RA.1